MRQVNPELVKRAKVMRRDATPAEDRLWKVLRNRELCGVKFRRQHSMGPYILDFYAPSHRLAIELDGVQHGSDEQRAYDTERTSYLVARGVSVIRFTNLEMEQCDRVIASIADVLRTRLESDA